MSETFLKDKTPNLELMPRADVPALWTDFRARFESLSKTADTLTVTSVDQVPEMKLARETRLTLKHLRIEIESKRKELGEEALRRKQRIDGDARVLKELIEPLEARMFEQETFVEREQERLQRERYTRRFEELRPFLTPGLDNGVGLGLSNLTEEDYQKFLTDTKAVHEARLERERKEKEVAEATAKAERDRIEQQWLENERLKKEAQDRENKIRKEREAAVAERKVAEEISRKEREAREKIEAELANKKAQEAKIEADRIKAEKKAAAAPDKRKIAKLASDVRELVLPTLKNETVRDAIASQVQKFATWIDKQGESL